MNVTGLMTDRAILELLGRRLAAARVRQNLTQAELARRAGIAKRTLEGMEAGRSPRLVSLVRVLRVLDLVEGLAALIPDEGPSPLELWESGRPRRVRASPGGSAEAPGEWQWGDA